MLDNHFKMTPQAVTVVDFFAALYHNIDASMLCEHRLIKAKQVTPSFHALNNGMAATHLRENADGWHIYHGINPRFVRAPKQRGTKYDISHLVAVHIDLDAKDYLSDPVARAQGDWEAIRAAKPLVAADIHAVIKQTGVLPSIVIDSGRGYQLYYLFDAPISLPCLEMEEVTMNGVKVWQPKPEQDDIAFLWTQTIERVEDLNKRINAAFQHADTTTNIDRIFRTPGSLNMKPVRENKKSEIAKLSKDDQLRLQPEDRTPIKQPVTIMWFDPARRYPIEALEQVFQKVTRPTAKSHVTTTKTTITPLPPVNTSDEWILKQVAAKDPTTWQLWNAVGSTDRSKDVFHVLTSLAFWTRKDAARMRSLFEQSPLCTMYADKWGRLADREIAKAISAQSMVYKGQEQMNADTSETTMKNQYRSLRSEAITLLKSSKVQEAVSLLVRNWRIVEKMLTRDQLQAFVSQYVKNVTDSEIAAAIETAFGQSQSQQPPVSAIDLPENLTDTGNAMRLARLHGPRLRFCPEWGKWLTWNGKIWEKDKGHRISVMQFAGDVIKSLYADAAKCDDPDRRKLLAQWARKTESRDALSSMIDLTIAQPGIAISQDQLDADPMLLNVNNGILNLRTGQLMPHNRMQLMTHIIPIDYDPDAICPRWKTFLETTMNKNAEMIAFLQRALGYTLTGDVSEQCLFFLHGSGKNGKSTFINILSHILGSYRKNLKIDSLLSRNHDSIPNDIARLAGARCVTTSEIEEGRRLNESLIKDLTGGDTISARFMRSEWFDFVPIFKGWMFGNHKPEIRGTDEGIWRRVRLIPFAVQIPIDQRDPKLGEKLKREATGILAWMTRGCLEWQQHGLQEPETVTQATQKYREDMDTLADFFAEYTVIMPTAKCTKQEMYAAYATWAASVGMGALKNQSFNLRIKERFPDVKEDRGSQNKPIWRGIGLLDAKKDHATT